MDTVCISKSSLLSFDGKKSFNITEMDRQAFIEDPYDTMEDFDYEEMKSETRRLATYNNWPKDSSIKPIDLAAAGFFYIGKQDTVKCFSCGVQLKQWVKGDDPFTEHKKHKPNCNFVKLFDKPLDVVSTTVGSAQSSTPMNMPIDSPSSPQVDHPCPIRNTNQAAHVNPMHQHIEYPPSFRRDSEPPAMPAYLNQRFIQQPSTSVNPPVIQFSNHRLELLSTNLPAQQPIQATSFSHDNLQLPFPAGPYIPNESYVPSRSASLPGYHNFSPENEYRPSPEEPLSYSWPRQVPDDLSDYNARLLTFKYWSPSNILKPSELANAGFYYTGTGDGVICYKCQVSLKGWEPNDTPWGEHKKWSPNCPLVLEHLRGERQQAPTENNESFPGSSVREVSRQASYPGQSLSLNLQQQNQQPIVTGMQKTRNVQHLITPHHFQQSNATHPPLQPLEHGTSRALTPSQAQRVISPSLPSQSMESGGLTQSELDKVHEMGFAREVVQNAIETQVANTGSAFANVDDLVQALLYHQGFKEPKRKSGGNKKKQCLGGSSTSENAQQSATSNAAGETSENNMQRELERMQEARLCKVCMDEDVGVVFLPCGHLVCCPDCAEGMKICPMCRGDITESIRTYFS